MAAVSSRAIASSAAASVGVWSRRMPSAARYSRIQSDVPPKRLVLAAILAAYAPVPHLVLRALRVVVVVVVAIVAVVVAVSPRAMFGRVGT